MELTKIANRAFVIAVNVGFVALCLAFCLLVLAFEVGLIADPKIWGPALAN